MKKLIEFLRLVTQSDYFRGYVAFLVILVGIVGGYGDAEVFGGFIVLNLVNAITVVWSARHTGYVNWYNALSPILFPIPLLLYLYFF